MPTTFSEMISNEATVTFAYKSRTYTVVYYPEHVTPQAFTALKEMEANERTGSLEGADAAFTGQILMIIDLVKSWDVFEDTALQVMYPLTEAKLKVLPAQFLTEALKQIWGDMRPNSPTAQASIPN